MPLRGVRVLDFTRHLPGPYATDLLLRLGAEVVKIEPPDGDPTRWLPPIADDAGALFHLVNSGKKSVAVDLKSEEGRAFCHRLVEQCDIVVESYRPGVADGFGIGWGALSSVNPRLIYCSISGYGAADARSSHDLNFVALAGLLELQRDHEGRPVLPATQIGDMGGALFAAIAILAAVIERQRTGVGRRIDIAMSDATRALMPTAEAFYRGTHHTPKTFLLTGALPEYNVYRTSDDQYLAVAPLEPQFWKAFCETIGRPELIDRQYDEKSREERFRLIRAAIASRSRDEWEARFAGVDACVTPVLSIEEAHERFGDPMARHPLQTNFPAQRPERGPSLSGDIDAVATMAGYDEAERKQLARRFRPRHRLQQFIRTSVLKLRRS